MARSKVGAGVHSSSNQMVTSTTTFIHLNADIILEVTRYLGDTDLLALAQACKHASHVAEIYTYWHPYSLPTSRAISAFLPTDHVGPWASYSVSAVREAIVQKKRFEKVWKSERVYPKSRVRLGRPKGSLQAVPNSRWLIDKTISTETNVHNLTLIDGKTRKMTEPIDILDDVGLEVKYIIAAASSRNPNEILLAVMLASGVWPERASCSVYRLTLTQKANHRLRVSRSHQSTFKNIHYGDEVRLQDDYLVVVSYAGSAYNHIDIGHIELGRLWRWDLPVDRDFWTGFLFDDWYIACVVDNSECYGIAIHLPSLATSEAAQSDVISILPEGTKLYIPYSSDELGFDILGRSLSIAEVDDSRLAATTEDRFTVVVSTPPEDLSQPTSDLRSSYVISVLPPVESSGILYGEIILLTQPKDLPTDEELQPAPGHSFRERDARGHAALRQRPRYKIPHCRHNDLEVIHYWVKLERLVSEIKITDLYGQGWTRSIVWDDDAADGQDRFVPTNVTLWDTGLGMLLLQRVNKLRPASIDEETEIEYEVWWL